MTLLLDTGPLVAAIDRSDKHHARYAALLESLDGPFLIPTTVIVEVCWLVEERPDIEAAFLDSVVAGEFKYVAITAADLARTAELVRAYADLPLGAVDASVIAVAERLKLTEVASLDRRHFTVVRPKARERPEPAPIGGYLHPLRARLNEPCASATIPTVSRPMSSTRGRRPVATRTRSPRSSRPSSSSST